MNLTPKVVRQIERGEKTQHRVPVKPPRWVKRAGPRGTVRAGESSRYLAQPFKPVVGDSLIVQTAREHEDETKRLPEVRVIVTDLATSRVGDITTNQATAEGFGSLAEFAADWMRRHDQHWPPQTEALCKECDGHAEYRDHDGQLVDCDYCDLGVVMVDDKPTVEVILDRFERKHAHHLVYVVTFELQVDITRFLNRRPSLPPTTSIGEALDPTAPLLGPPSKEWKQRADAHHREALKDRDGARLAGLDKVAADLEAETELLSLLTGVDVTHDVFVIKQRLAKLRARIASRPDQRRAA